MSITAGQTEQVLFSLTGAQLGLVDGEGTLALCPGRAELELTTGVAGSVPVVIQATVDVAAPLVIEAI